MRHPAHTLPTPTRHSDMTPTLHGVDALGSYQDQYRDQDRRPETGANSRAVLLSSTLQGLGKRAKASRSVPSFQKRRHGGAGAIPPSGIQPDRMRPMTHAVTQDFVSRARMAPGACHILTAIGPLTGPWSFFPLNVDNFRRTR